MMKKDYKKYVIELDGATYGFIGNGLEKIIDLKDIGGDKWLITDFQEAVSRTMTVEAEFKYVELVVRRKLQESGEFDEPVSVITHWKKKKGKNVTDIFFTAIPTRTYYKYIDQIREDQDSVMLFPLYLVLFGALKNIRTKGPVAVVFQHGRFADLIIGTKTRVYYVNRCVAFDTEEEQIAALWDTVRTDIKAVESENRIKITKVFSLTWLDSRALPEWPEDMEAEFYSFEDTAVSFDGAIHNISFLNAIGMQSGLGSISSFMEKTFYYAGKSIPYLNVFLLLAVILLAGGYFRYHQKADQLHQEFIALDKRIDRIQLESPLAISKKRYKNTLSFIRDLNYYRSAPSYKKVINDISGAISSDMKVSVLKMDYTDDEVCIEIFGRIKAPFDIAYKGYQSFMGILRQNGYTVKESRFDTEIRDSQFLVKFVKRIQ